MAPGPPSIPARNQFARRICRGRRPCRQYQARRIRSWRRIDRDLVRASTIKRIKRSWNRPYRGRVVRIWLGLLFSLGRENGFSDFSDIASCLFNCARHLYTEPSPQLHGIGIDSEARKILSNSHQYLLQWDLSAVVKGCGFGVFGFELLEDGSFQRESSARSEVMVFGFETLRFMFLISARAYESLNRGYIEELIKIVVVSKKIGRKLFGFPELPILLRMQCLVPLFRHRGF